MSDILTKKPLPEEMSNNVAFYVGCIAGASSKDEYEGWLKGAGFADVLVADAGSDLNVYTRVGREPCCGPSSELKEQKERSRASCCGPQTSDGGVAEDMRKSLKDVDLNEWAGTQAP